MTMKDIEKDSSCDSFLKASKALRRNILTYTTWLSLDTVLYLIYKLLFTLVLCEGLRRKYVRNLMLVLDLS